MSLTDPYRQHSYMGQHADDAAALVFIRAQAWDSNGDGTGAPQRDMSYYDTTFEFLRYWNGTGWIPFGGEIYTVIDGSSGAGGSPVLWSITVADHVVVHIHAFVVGRQADGAERNAYGKVALAYREGGGAVLEGVADLHPDIESDGAWNAYFDVNNNDIRLRVTGDAGNTVWWTGRVAYRIVFG